LNVLPKLEVFEESTHIALIERMNGGSVVHGVLFAKWREIHLGNSRWELQCVLGKDDEKRCEKLLNAKNMMLRSKRKRQIAPDH
jgi:hypothetical protein